MRRSLLSFLLAILVGIHGAAGQDSPATPDVQKSSLPIVQAELGAPFPSKHFPTSEHGYAPENWAVAQDDRGLVYIGNDDGLLQYDGERWRIVRNTKGSVVRSLAADSSVFVGRKGDFGVLQPNSHNRLRYQSLLSHVEPDKRDVGDVWKTHAVDDGVYYQSRKYLFRWDGDEMTSWRAESSFHTSFVVEDRLYVRDREHGLLVMQGDSLAGIPGGDAFAETPIQFMASHPSGKYLIGTQDDGLVLLDGSATEPFAPALTPYLEKHTLYHGTSLSEQRYALATLGGGVVIVNAEGQILRILDKSSGLPDEVVNYVYEGSEGELWLAMNNDGVFRANLDVSTTLYDERRGLKGTIRHIYNHEGTLQVATGNGLHTFMTGESATRNEGRAHFEKQDDYPLTWQLLTVGETLLAATERGVYRFMRDRVQKIADGHTYVLSSTDDEQTLFAGTRTGLSVLNRVNGDWETYSVTGVEEELRDVEVQSERFLWASSRNGDILGLRLSDDQRSVTETIRFDESSGLPAGYKSPLLLSGQRLIIRSREGLFKPENPDDDPKNWTFTVDPALLPDIERSESLLMRSFLEDAQGVLWVALNQQVFRGQPRESEGYSWERVSSIQFPERRGVKLYREDDGVLWAGTATRLLRHDPNAAMESADTSRPYRALIRGIRVVPNDKVVYGGVSTPQAGGASITVPYSENNLAITVTAPLHDRATDLQYQYRLPEHMEDWSNWTEESSFTQTNLWEGTYDFEVRARDEWGRISESATATIHIQPPWYRTGWAYLGYLLALGVLGVGMYRYRQIRKERNRARAEAEKLEKERKALRKLEEANERLREANRLKENFLANASHELRTPLTNILGAVEALRDFTADAEERFLDTIKNNGKRLERTLNALLDLSRLRSGDGDTVLATTPVPDRVQSITAEFQSWADKKGVDLRMDLPREPAYVHADERYLDQILRNLVENAIKFTDEGYVRVLVDVNGETVEIDVEDTGIGIDEEFLPQLFDAFEQESRGKARSYEGFGLGLAISAQLVEVMGGNLRAESTKGEGTTFMLSLPRATPSVDDATSSNGETPSVEPSGERTSVPESAS